MISQIQRFSILFFLIASFCSPVNAVWQQPPHEFPITEGFKVPLGSDAHGHAFAIPTDFEFTIADVFASYYSSGIWQDPPEVIGDGRVRSQAYSIDFAMDNTGTGLAIWYDRTSGEFRTAHFNGIVWNTPPPIPLDTGTPLNSGRVAVSMNGPNSGVAIWIDNNTTTVSSSFFSNVAWSLPVPIGTGDFSPSVAYSTNGTAVAGWTNVLNVTVNHFNGSIWQGPIILDATGSQPVVGIDSTGKMLAVWANILGNVVYSISFNGISWSAPAPITGTAGNIGISLVMTPSGTAVASWIDSTGAGFSSSYNGFGWSAPILITAGPILDNFLALSVADNGNALAVWSTTTSEIRSSRLRLGDISWAPEEFVGTYTLDTLFDVNASLSEDGTGFASWAAATEGSGEQFASVELLPVPASPSNLQGFCCKNKFAMQTECADTITWSPSIDPTVIAYYVRKNGVLVAVIPAQGPFIYVDHVNCRDADIYTVSAVDLNGTESLPVSITLSCR